MGGGPLSRDSSIASPSCQTSTGVGRYLHGPGGGKLTGSSTCRAAGKHVSAPARLVQIRGADLLRPLSRIGSPTTALQLPQRRHIIPSLRGLASMHPLAARSLPPDDMSDHILYLGKWEVPCQTFL